MSSAKADRAQIWQVDSLWGSGAIKFSIMAVDHLLVLGRIAPAQDNLTVC